MRTTAALGITVLLVSPLTVSGQEGGSPYEAVVKEMLALTDQMSTVLEGVTDAGTAADAKPALKKAVEQFVEVRKKSEALRQPDLQEKERLEREYRKKMDQSLMHLRRDESRAPGGGRTGSSAGAFAP